MIKQTMVAMFVVASMAAGVGTYARQLVVRGGNFDPAQVRNVLLIDPLRTRDGGTITSLDAWRKQQRPWIMETFTTQVYGRTPAERLEQKFALVEESHTALGHRAIRKQIKATYSSEKGEHSFHILLYLPMSAAAKPVPVVAALNFEGNQTVENDKAILLPEIHEKDTERVPIAGAVKPEGTPAFHAGMAPERSRGREKEQWQLEMLLEHGYGLATVFYGEIEPDIPPGPELGVRRLFSSPPSKESWGAIGVWAWGLSRIQDYLETEPLVDATRVAVMGHSRLGKAADWAAVQDSRFALLISNESGKGGASLLRRNWGESASHLNGFRNWFCGNFNQYSFEEENLPVDGNLLLALVAPRPVYVASAMADQWSDPTGEYLSAASLDPVYKLFGKLGLPAGKMPPADKPIFDARHAVGYHIRKGKHDVTAFDWKQYVAFMDEHLK